MKISSGSRYFALGQSYVRRRCHHVWMRENRLQAELEAGDTATGLFAPVGAECETPGVLSWTAERGAQLELADLTGAWPNDFDERFTVHGSIHSTGKLVTLMEARVIHMTAVNTATRIAASTLAIGEHTDSDETWAFACYAPPGLHEWFPENGLSMSHPDDDIQQVQVNWRPVAPVVVSLPDAELKLSLTNDYTWRGPASPNWSIETWMQFVVKPNDPMTIRDFWREYRRPLLGFVIFAIDRPEDIPYEVFSSPDSKREIVVLRQDRKLYSYDWRPNVGHLLFRADDIADVSDAFNRWLALYKASDPSVALFCETIMQKDYSPPRFLTLYTAAEGYWRSMRGTTWRPRDLAKELDVSVSKVDKQAVALIGGLRNYHSHLDPTDVEKSLEPDEVAEIAPLDVAIHTFEATRRLQALMQACLLRDIGLDTERVEELITQHYQVWPLP